jgi:hypothetical protein
VITVEPVTFAGAVYSPPALIVPTAGDTVQLTLGLDNPPTNTDNCRLWPAFTVAAGELTTTPTNGSTEATAAIDFVRFAFDVAVIVTAVLLVT